MSDPVQVGAIAGATAFLGGLVGRTVDKVQERLADRLATALVPARESPEQGLGQLLVEWKRGCVVNVVLRAEAACKRRGVEVRPVRLDFLLPLLEGAGYVEDPHLQEMFGELLAAGVESDGAQSPMWIRVLGQMSGDDAKVFVKCSEEADAVGINETQTGGPFDETDPRYVHLVRLQVMGLLTPVASAGSINYSRGTRENLFETGIVAAPTALGVQFRAVVTPPRPPTP